MSATPKKKLCWNCEGNVSRKEENCPFCGVYLHPDSITGNTAEIEEHTPPYRTTNFKSNEQIPAMPYANSADASSDEESTVDEKTQKIEEKTFSLNENTKNTMYALALLMSGSMFFLFGLVLILFSRNGQFSLQWNGNYWFIYLFASLPMLFIGWRISHRLSDSNL
jgi:hypothetical protein